MKTKLVSFFFALCYSLSAFAYDAIIDGIYYNLNSTDLTAEVTNETGDYQAKSYSGSVTIPETVTYSNTTYRVTEIGDDAFYRCSGLTSVTIGNSVTTIGDYAFEYCSGLTSVTIGNSVTTIGSSAFKYCTGLTSVTIGNSVTTIGNSAFEECRGLTKTNYMGNIADWCKIKFGSYGANPMCYSHNFYINDIEVKDDLVIPEGVEAIGDFAFYSCSGLTSVTIPNSVTTIGNYAFAYCRGLTSVTIPNSVTTIGDNAFSDCTGLTSVTIPNSVTTIGNSAFYYCTNLTSITIPNSVTTIGYWTFYGCTGLTSVTIPNSVTEIGDYAFYYCSGLTSVTIPNSVTTIGYNAFYGCSGLTSVTIPNSVTAIEDYAFQSCISLTSVTIGNSVTTIGSSAFKYCTGLTDIYCYVTTPPTAQANTFQEVSHHCYVHVPVGTVRAYQLAPGWNEFYHFFEMLEVPSGEGKVDVQVTENSAVFSWPVNPTASSYTLIIKKDDVVFCTLTFNSLGQLVGMAFAPTRNMTNASSAETTTYGYSFVVSNLDTNSTYDFVFTAKDAADNVLSKEVGKFTTIPTDLIDVNDNSKSLIQNSKLIKDGHLLIRRDGNLFTATGAKVK